MKTSVRFLSMLLAVLMIASAALTASATDADATANSEALQLLVDLGIFGGYDDGSLKPENQVERDEMAKIIFVLYTKFTDAGAGVVSFKDVAADNWAAGYISWCSSKGIVGGYGDGNFGPDDKVTYDQALKMVCGALGYTDWDPKFWPTDVRTKALNDLALGENLTGVKGGDYVTRAQVAQIVYNALFADMNETKNKEVPLFENILIQVPVAKTLAVDVWNFAEINAVVTATNNVGLYALEATDTDNKNYVRLDWTEKNDKNEDVNKHVELELEELGLEAYADKLSDLFMSKVRIIYDDSDKKFDTDKIIATSVSLTADKDITIETNEKKDAVIIAGEKLDSDDKVSRYTIGANGIVTEADFTLRDVPAEDMYYSSIAYDFDDNGEYDAIYWEYINAYEVHAANDKKVEIKLYGESNVTSYDVDEIVTSATLAEDDVIIAAKLYDKFVVLNKIAPVEAAATKYNGTKVTLDGVGEVQINKAVFASNAPVYGRVTESVMNLNDKGETAKSTYYIYDGKVFGHEGIIDNSDLQFAVISYFDITEDFDINKDSVLNEETMEYTIENTALVSIDGKQQVVTVNPADSINGLKLNEEADRATIIEKYGKSYIENDDKTKYINNRYILATYKVNDNGEYTFTVGDKLEEYIAAHEDYICYPAGSTIKLNEETGLYEIYAADGQLLNNRVKLADSLLMYYTSKKSSTGDYKYLNSYAKDTMPEKFSSIVTKEAICATYDADTKFANIQLTLVDNKTLELIGEKKTSYKEDARQIYYCTAVSTEAMASNGKDVEITYNFKSIYHGENTSFVDPDGKTSATRGSYYAWDEDIKDYVKVTSTESFAKFTIDEVVNGCLFTVEDEFANGIKIPDEAAIWGVVINQYAAYRTYTPDSLADMVDLVKEYNEANPDKKGALDVVVGTHLDHNGKKVINTLIIRPYEMADGALSLDEKGGLRFNTANAGLGSVSNR